MDIQRFSLASELEPNKQSKALCDGRVDAIIFTVGHPSESIKEATKNCKASLVDVSGEAVDKLVADNPFYRITSILGEMYVGNSEDVFTFGVGATLVAPENVSEDSVYQIVQAAFDNFGVFRNMHPALKTLKREEMVKDGLSVPLHAGAKRYYTERKLIKTKWYKKLWPF